LWIYQFYISVFYNSIVGVSFTFKFQKYIYSFNVDSNFDDFFCEKRIQFLKGNINTFRHPCIRTWGEKKKENIFDWYPA